MRSGRTNLPGLHAAIRADLDTRREILRIACEELARRKGHPSPSRISRRLIDLNLAALAGAADLDRTAAPIQAAGVPIIRRDVPVIDTHSEFYDGPRSAVNP